MIRIIKTGDGSHTLLVPDLNEHYHSTFGAIQESMHVFIDAGLDKCKGKQNIAILEMGFGTGLNALLTVLNMTDASILYHGVEAYPLEKEVLAGLNYPELLSNANAKDVFSKLHDAEWGKKVLINENYHLIKINGKIQEIKLPVNFYELVYFDAFAPDIQPELWAEEIFTKIFHAMKPGGILVTYSAKGLVKQNLRKAGFVVKRLAGPPGKKHMLRAEKH